MSTNLYVIYLPATTFKLDVFMQHSIILNFFGFDLLFLLLIASMDDSWLFALFWNRDVWFISGVPNTFDMH